MYEYDFVNLSYDQIQELRKAASPESPRHEDAYAYYCNQRARDGWRLHSVTFGGISGSLGTLIFERQVKA
jgi:hypothetical protein